MVLLCGLPTESPFDFLGDALEELKTPFEIFSPRNLEDFYLSYQISNGKLTGEICFGKQSFDLNEITGIYNRLIDFSITPEYKNLLETSHEYIKLRTAFTQFNTWLAITDAKVLNHTKPMLSNSSKPYQMMLIQEAGFKVPDSLITNDIISLNNYYAQHGKIIYKSASGVRSIVQNYEPSDQNKNLEACPTLFQQCLVGINYRVHVVGQKVFATKINSNALDYRYARQVKKTTQLEETFLSQEIEQKCIALATSLKLPLAGIDLMQSNDGDWYCFEVNPSPGYTYYESNTNQPISLAIAEYLRF